MSKISRYSSRLLTLHVIFDNVGTIKREEKNEIHFEYSFFLRWLLSLMPYKVKKHCLKQVYGNPTKQQTQNQFSAANESSSVRMIFSLFFLFYGQCSKKRYNTWNVYNKWKQTSDQLISSWIHDFFPFIYSPD